MKSKGLITLVAATVIVGAYAIYDYQSEKKTEAIQELQSKITPYNPEDLVEIRLENSGVELVKENGTWQIRKPVQDIADQKAVEAFTSELTQEKSTAVIDENVDLKTFALDKPKAKIQFKSTDGVMTTISVSEMKNFEGESYIRVNEDPKVLVSPGVWENKAQKTSFDFRDKRLMRLPLMDVTEIHNKGAQSFTLELKDHKWVAKSANLPIDQNKVREFLTSLSTTSATEFFNDIKPLTKVDQTLELKMKDNKVWVAQIQKQKDFAIVSISEPRLQFKIPAHVAEKMTKISLNDYREVKEDKKEGEKKE